MFFPFKQSSIQSFSLVGRYHVQYRAVDSEDNSDGGWENFGAAEKAATCLDGACATANGT